MEVELNLRKSIRSALIPMPRKTIFSNLSGKIRGRNKKDFQSIRNLVKTMLRRMLPGPGRSCASRRGAPSTGRTLCMREHVRPSNVRKQLDHLMVRDVFMYPSLGTARVNFSLNDESLHAPLHTLCNKPQSLVMQGQGRCLNWGTLQYPAIDFRHLPDLCCQLASPSCGSAW